MWLHCCGSMVHHGALWERSDALGARGCAAAVLLSKLPCARAFLPSWQEFHMVIPEWGLLCCLSVVFGQQKGS